MAASCLTSSTRWPCTVPKSPWTAGLCASCVRQRATTSGAPFGYKLKHAATCSLTLLSVQAERRDGCQAAQRPGLARQGGAQAQAAASDLSARGAQAGHRAHGHRHTWRRAALHGVLLGQAAVSFSVPASVCKEDDSTPRPVPAPCPEQAQAAVLSCSVHAGPGHEAQVVRAPRAHRLPQAVSRQRARRRP